jgi:hypothetical protein
MQTPALHRGQARQGCDKRFGLLTVLQPVLGS